MKKLLLFLFSLMLSFNSYGEIRSEIHYNKSGELHGKFMMWMDAELIIDAIYKDGKCVSAKPTARTVKNNNCLLYIDADLEIEQAKIIKAEEPICLLTEPLLEKARKALEEAYKELEEEKAEKVAAIRLRLVNTKRCVLPPAGIAILNDRFWEALIAIKVKSYWNYSGADDDWSCNVIVHQKDGKVLTVNIQDCKKGSNALMEDDKVRAFMNSIERAVYKASPLTIGLDGEIFDRQVQFRFSAN